MDEKIKELVEKAKLIPDKFVGKQYQGGIIEKTTSFIHEASDIGKLVAIRSVRPEDGDKTMLGVYIGSRVGKDNFIPSLNKTPAIYVFELDSIRCGYESWWGILPDDKLESLTYDQLLDEFNITKIVIQNAIVNYVVAAVSVAKEQMEKEKKN